MRPSGSKLALLPHCRYFARPDVAWPEDEAGDAARFGNAIHTLVDALLRDRPMPIDEAMLLHGVPESERLRVAKVWGTAIDYITPLRRIGWRSELPLAWDWTSDTARELESRGHRDYSQALPTEIPLTLDVATMDGDVAEVRDWKTGQTPLESYAAQATIGALAWARVTGASRARAVFTHLGEDGAHEHAWEYDAMGLDAAAHELTAALESAATGKPEPTPGPHCSDLYCPLRATCPATLAVVRSNDDIAPLAALVDRAITTPAQAGEAYRKLRLVKEAVKVVEDRIRAIVEASGEAPTAPGKVIRLVTTTRETFSKDRLPPERRDDVLRDLRDLGALSFNKSTYLKEGKGER